MSEDFGTVVLNDVTRFGLRRVHIMRTGKRVDPATWVHAYPEEAESSLEFFSFRDRELKDTWHLWMVWHVREKYRITFIAPTDGATMPVDGVLWYIEKKQKMSDEIGNAVMKYLVEFDRWPEKALVAKLPKGAPNHLTWKDEDGTHMLKLEEDERIPERCVFVYGTDEKESEIQNA